MSQQLYQKDSQGVRNPMKKIEYTLDLTREYYNLLGLEDSVAGKKQSFFWDGNVASMEEDGLSSYYLQDDLESVTNLARLDGESRERFAFDKFGLPVFHGTDGKEAGYGFARMFIVCGAAGVLQKGIQVGHLVIPCTAVRDEGVSYHYIEPSREIDCNQHAVSIIEKHLQKKNISYINAKTWTTDAFYRETEDKIALRVSEGCVTVEMEAAAFFAVSKFRNVTLGQVLFCGDDLSGAEWDSRSWNSREEIKKNLVELSFEICLQL